jgi:hypothetical protein
MSLKGRRATLRVGLMLHSALSPTSEGRLKIDNHLGMCLDLEPHCCRLLAIAKVATLAKHAGIPFLLDASLSVGSVAQLVHWCRFGFSCY